MHKPILRLICWKLVTYFLLNARKKKIGMKGSFTAKDGPGTESHENTGIDTNKVTKASVLDLDAKLDTEKWPQLPVLLVTQTRNKVVQLKLKDELGMDLVLSTFVR